MLENPIFLAEECANAHCPHRERGTTSKEGYYSVISNDGFGGGDVIQIGHDIISI